MGDSANSSSFEWLSSHFSFVLREASRIFGLVIMKCELTRLLKVILLSGTCLLPVVLCGQGAGIVDDQRQKDPFDYSLPSHKNESLEQRVERLRIELAEAEKELKASQLNSDTSIPAEAGIPVAEVSNSEMLTGSLVVITGDNGSGSGFLAQIKGRVFMVTNVHVLGAARGANITTIDGVDLVLGQGAYLSKERDVAIVPVDWDGPVLKLSPSLRFDEVEIGQSIIVMGNSGGANVATRLKGVIRGIGPDELEVSAKFVPGNSGSPIVHSKLGTVIAVASHLKDFSSDSKWTENTEFDKIRRFGYRLDGEIAWEQVSLSELYRQGEAYQSFEDRTAAMWNISYTLTYDSKLLTSYRDHDSIGHLYSDISSDFNWNRGTASAHNTQMLRRFINGMRSELQSDLSAADKLISLSYYQKQYDSIKGYRDQIRENLTRFANSRL